MRESALLPKMASSKDVCPAHVRLSIFNIYWDDWEISNIPFRCIQNPSQVDAQAQSHCLFILAHHALNCGVLFILPCTIVVCPPSYCVTLCTPSPSLLPLFPRRSIGHPLCLPPATPNVPFVIPTAILVPPYVSQPPRFWVKWPLHKQHISNLLPYSRKQQLRECIPFWVCEICYRHLLLEECMPIIDDSPYDVSAFVDRESLTNCRHVP